MTKKGLNFNFIWGAVMVVVYCTMAFTLFFTNIFSQVNTTIRIILGILFLVYGVMRAVNIWQKR